MELGRRGAGALEAACCLCPLSGKTLHLSPRLRALQQGLGPEQVLISRGGIILLMKASTSLFRHHYFKNCISSLLYILALFPLSLMSATAFSSTHSPVHLQLEVNLVFPKSYYSAFVKGNSITQYYASDFSFNNIPQ